MSPTSIGIELYNNKNEMEKSKDNNSEEKQTFIMEKPKIYEVEGYQASIPSKKHKNDKYSASIISTKKILTQFTKKKNQGRMWLRKPTHLLSPQKRALAQSTNQRNHKHTQKQLIPPKQIIIKQLKDQTNQGIFQ